MNNILNNIKKHFLFYLILLLSLFLRAYRIEELTTFGVDQGVDFLVVRDMIVNHKWTLIGIKSSVGEFFQGPIALYILYPFFMIFNLNPIAGAYTALVFSVLTLVVLYITVSKYFSQKTALFASLLFAVSPELIMYGNSPLYQHFLPLCVILSFYFFLKNKKNIKDYFTIGLLVGLGMELHFLNIVLGVSLFIHFLLYEYKGVRYQILYALGILFGLFPTVLFELRHNFLNIRLFLDYIKSDNGSNFDIYKYIEWFTGGAKFVGGNSIFLGASILILFFFLVYNRKKETYEMKILKRLATIIFLVLNIMLTLINDFYSQYAQSFWLILIILLPVYTFRYMQKTYAFSLLAFVFLCNLYYSVSRLGYNHGYNMPDGLTLSKIEKIGESISLDSREHPNFNIASLLDGGTRAYPYRYSVIVRGGEPAPVTDYPNNNYLYLIAREKFDSKTWEVSSMLPYAIGKKWDFDDEVYLYRLEKILKK